MKSFDVASTTSWRPDLESDLADIARHELTEAGATRVYVIAESTLDRNLDGAWGVFGPALSILYQPQLADHWQGPAPAILLANRLLRTVFARGESAAGALIAVAAHEIGHVVEANPRFYRSITAGPVMQQQARHSMETLAPEESAMPTGEFPFEGHSPEWARITIHAGYRLQQRGWPVNFDSAWCPARTNLWRGGTLHSALSVELSALANVPLSQLVQIPPPAYFTELISICARPAVPALKG